MPTPSLRSDIALASRDVRWWEGDNGAMERTVIVIPYMIRLTMIAVLVDAFRRGSLVFLLKSGCAIKSIFTDAAS